MGRGKLFERGLVAPVIPASRKSGQGGQGSPAFPVFGIAEGVGAIEFDLVVAHVVQHAQGGIQVFFQQQRKGEELYAHRSEFV